MSEATSSRPSNHDHRCFAAYYNRVAGIRLFRGSMDRARLLLTQQANGAVLEVGAGGGQNFGFYDPVVTQRVEAIEPNRHMLSRAKSALRAARVPIQLTQAAAECLPFADGTFDSVLVTLVLCSVDDQVAALREIRRALKPGGRLLLLEHVRSRNRFSARLQDWLTPLQRRLAGNCHLNRDTGALVREVGFRVQSEVWSGSGGLQPLLTMVAGVDPGGGKIS